MLARRVLVEIARKNGDTVCLRDIFDGAKDARRELVGDILDEETNCRRAPVPAP